MTNYAQTLQLKAYRLSCPEQAQQSRTWIIQTVRSLARRQETPMMNPNTSIAAR
jgi:hypothetical protein